MAAGTLQEKAPAKLNLFLHVLGRRDDGYHELDSLIVFAGLGDELSLRDAEGFSLSASGPHADRLPPQSENLVLEAARRFADAVPGANGAHFSLLKQVPVEAGLGGGSADAAAALRLLARRSGRADRALLLRLAAEIGSDVPVCLEGRAAWIAGRGERVDAGPALPRVDAVLVTPPVGVSTVSVFSALRPPRGEREPTRRPRAFKGFADLVGFLAETENDLTATACALAPPIAACLAAVGGTKGCALARMTGSGSSVFGLYEEADAARAAAARLSRGFPHWWVAATVLG